MKHFVFCALMLLCLPGAVDAREQTISHSVYVAKAQSRYMVSGVLRKGSTEMSIRLVHSIHTASNSDEALGLFTRQVMVKFPGYSILSTLVTEVEIPKSQQCDVVI